MTYTPAADYNGTDSFTYKANDGTLDSNEVTVTITVTAVNDAAVADAKTVTTDEDTPVGIILTGSDVDGDTLTFSIVTPPTQGMLSGTSPNLTYTPAADYNGTDSFTYKANDGTLDSNEATVTITVTAVNDAPVAEAKTVTTDEDTPVGIILTGSDVDGDTLTFSIVTPPTQGMLSGTSPNLTYTPAADYNGTDSFTYKANDGTLDSNEVTVTITVTAVNDAAVATGDIYVTDEDTTLMIATPGVLGNDTDIDSASLIVVLVSEPSHGSLTLDEDGSFNYHPAADYNGIDSFTYQGK